MIRQRAKALDAFRRVYYEFPLSQQANDAQSGIERLQTPALVPADLFTMELARAERLFSARRWAQARAAFAPLTRAATGDDKELVALRLAECDYYAKRYRLAREALDGLTESPTRGYEARYFLASAVKALGDRDDFATRVTALVHDAPASPWSAEALNALAALGSQAKEALPDILTLAKDKEEHETVKKAAAAAAKKIGS